MRIMETGRLAGHESVTVFGLIGTGVRLIWCIVMWRASAPARGLRSGPPNGVSVGPSVQASIARCSRCLWVRRLGLANQIEARRVELE